ERPRPSQTLFWSMIFSENRRLLFGIMLSLRAAGRHRCPGTRLLTPFEILQLARDDPVIAVGSDPADVPRVEPVDRLPASARILASLGEGDLFGRLLRNDLLRFGEMRVIVVADRADRKTARTVAERADDPQQPLPEAKVIARAHHRDQCIGRSAPRLRVDALFPKLQNHSHPYFLAL